VILIDANLLIYAYDASSPQHERARAWLEDVLSRSRPVRFAWMTILAFLRITTNHRAFANPLSTAEAVANVSAWLAQPAAGVVEPGEHHWRLMCTLLPVAQARGPLVMDAHLAALAIEYGAVLYTADRDFSRFPDLNTVNPLEAES
jgi:toxin-antitoxin system PIN domain toxin